MIAGVHVPDSQWRAHETHSRLQTTHALRQANLAGSLAMATAQESMHSRQDSAHVQQALSEFFSPLPAGACASPTAATATNPHKLKKILRIIIVYSFKKLSKLSMLNNHFAKPRTTESKGRAKKVRTWRLTDSPDRIGRWGFHNSFRSIENQDPLFFVLVLSPKDVARARNRLGCRSDYEHEHPFMEHEHD